MPAMSEKTWRDFFCFFGNYRPFGIRGKFGEGEFLDDGKNIEAFFMLHRA